MPDDDYEETVVCGCASCAKINDDMNKAMQITALLNFIDKHIAVVKEDDYEVYSAIKNITKILRIMNGIAL